MQKVKHEKGVTQIRRRTLTPASLEWRNDQPYATDFDDIYFSSEQARMLDEIEHVFLKPNRIAERLQTLLEPKQTSTTVTIGELGFGTGLNFFSTANLFIALSLSSTQPSSTQPSSTLHFISFEKHPLSKSDFQRFATQLTTHLPSLHDLIDALLAQYPLAIEGIHRITFPKHNIQLTLVYGDAQDQLQTFNQHSAQMDAWFLDGFAPSKNPSMWTPELFTQMAKLSKKGTSYSTFTAASRVRHALQEAGFSVQKIPGFGRKREMIAGELETNRDTTDHTDIRYSPKETPWFIPSKPIKPLLRSKPGSGKNPTHCDAIVIGGGLSGTAVAYHLAIRGAQVTLIERQPALAQGASGNLMGALFTKFTPYDTAQNRFYQYAYLDAINHLKMFEQQLDGNTLKYWNRCGVLQLAYDKKERERQHALITSACWPTSVIQPVNKEEIASLCGFSSPHSGLFLPGGGWVHPPSLCSLRTQHSNINVLVNSDVITLKQSASQSEKSLWSALDQHQHTLASAPHLIICNAHDAVQFQPTEYMPLSTIRGQLTYLPETETSRLLKTVICYNGYTGPSIKGTHTIGATFQPKSKRGDMTDHDHETNLNNLIQGVPAFAHALGAHAAGIKKTLDAKPTETPTAPNQDPGFTLLNEDNRLNGLNRLSKLNGRVAFRTQTPDYLPIVGPVPNQQAFSSAYAPLKSGSKHLQLPCGDYLEGLFINCGHGSRGLTTSNLCANIITGYITAEPSPVDHEALKAIHPARFLIRNLRRNLD